MSYFGDLRKSLKIDVEKKAAGGEGLASDYMSFRNAFWGQMQPVSYPLLWRIYLESPEVSGAINALVDAVVGDGWRLKPLVRPKNDFSEGEKDKTVENLMDLLTYNEFSVALRDVVISMEIFGDGYLELVRENSERMAFDVVTEEKDGKKTDKIIRAYLMKADGSEVPVPNFDYAAYERSFQEKSLQRKTFAKAFRKLRGLASDQRTAGAGDTVSIAGALRQNIGRVVEFYPRAAETIQIDYNEHGEVIKYIQRVKHRRVDYYPDEMIHFPLNKIGNRVYGQSALLPLIYAIQTKMAAENYTYDYFRRGMMPRLVYNVMNVSEEQVKRMQQTMRNIKPQEDIMLFGDVKVTNVAPSNQDQQFKDLLKYLREQIFIALQVPSTLLGLTEGSNRNTSQTQMEMFDRKKNVLKRTIEDIINSQLFTYENFGVDAKFEFKDANSREELKQAQTLGLLGNSPYVHPNEVRAAYGLPKLEDSELLALGQLKAKFSPLKKPGQTDPNAVSPEKSGDRMDNAENQNVEQQMENKSVKKKQPLRGRTG